LASRDSHVDWPLAAAVLFLAIAVRAVVLWGGAEGLQQDVDKYRVLAENLRTTGVYGWIDAKDPSQVRPTRFRPPLYPLILAVFVSEGTLSLVAVGLLHFVLGITTVLLTYLFSARLRLGRWSAFAALLVACDPILLNQSTQVMTETLATALAALALVCLNACFREPSTQSAGPPTKQGSRPSRARSRWSLTNAHARCAHVMGSDSENRNGNLGPIAAGVAGVVLALAVLCRPTFLPWLGLCFLTVLLHPECKPRRWACGSAMLVCAAVVLAPWMMRNFRHTGKLHVTTSHGGYTLLLGNNPSFYQFLGNRGSQSTWDADELVRAWRRRAAFPDPSDPQWRNLQLAGSRDGPPLTGWASVNEEDDDRFAYALARRYMGDHPDAFAYACVVRVGRLWQWTPHQLSAREPPARRMTRYLVGVWYGGVFLLAFAGVIALGRRFLRLPWLWGLLLCVTFTGVHSLYWSNMRMRAPLMPFVCVVAAVGTERAAGWRRRRKSR
jgi:4-amino-4-deoxy-L-arabinose transferase-like glycosyltransferase